jgi:hypothetical protein
MGSLSTNRLVERIEGARYGAWPDRSSVLQACEMTLPQRSGSTGIELPG